jgi:hypothetical protein
MASATTSLQGRSDEQRFWDLHLDRLLRLSSAHEPKTRYECNTRRDADRLEASRLLADRGSDKAAVFAPQEGDPLDLSDTEAAAEEFCRRILRLAEAEEVRAAPGDPAAQPPG